MEIETDMRRLIIYVTTFLLFMLSMIPIQNKHTDLCDLENNTWQDGEMLRYKLYYNLSFIWIPAGEVTFQIKETDTTYEASIVGRSYGSYDNIFKVRDQFRSSIDKETLKPISFVRKVEEGNHRRFDSLTFDYKLDNIYSLSKNMLDAMLSPLL